MERSGSDTVLVLYPVKDSLCRAVVAAECRTAEVSVVKSSDSGIVTCGILQVLELGLKTVRTAAVYLLLTRDYLLAVNIGKVSHKALSLNSSQLVAGLGLLCLYLGCGHGLYCKVVEL